MHSRVDTVIGREYEERDLIELARDLEAENQRLREALTDALYAWGLVHSKYEGIESAMKNHDEAEERIQRARLALPKTAAAVTGAA